MAQIALPHQLTNGTVADATQVMNNFNAIVNVVNGNLGSDNLGSISGADVVTTDLNGGTNTLENFTKRFQAGVLSFLNVPSKEGMTQELVFPVPFPSPPRVFPVIAFAGSPQLHGVAALEVESSRCTIAVYNGSSTTINLHINWLAIYLGAWN